MLIFFFRPSLVIGVTLGLVVSPLLVILGLLVGALLGVILVHVVRAHSVPVQTARAKEEETAKRAARKAVDEVLTSLR